MREMRTVMIIGLGLMGGSLAAACRRKFPRARIIGVSRSRAAIRTALKKRWIDEGKPGGHERSAFVSPGFVILCTPVQTFPKLLLEIERAAKGKVLVTDVGSVKESILDFYKRRKWKRAVYVGAHPMVGSHLRGMDAARPDLYEKGCTFLVRTAGVSASDYALVKNFWKKIMPKVVEISASEHDRVVGQISHLPHAAAACLMLAAKGPALKFAAQGFHDTTRIAAGDPSIWLPIFRANRRVLAELLAEYEKSLSRLRRSLGKKKAGELQKILAQAARIRQEISL